MRRRTSQVTLLDRVDVLVVRWAARRGDWVRLSQMADDYGFGSVVALVAEANRHRGKAQDRG